MGWNRRKILRYTASLGLAAIAVALSIGIGFALPRLESDSATAYLSSQPTFEAIFRTHPQRIVATSVDAAFTNTGVSHVTVHESLRLAVADPLVPVIRDGEIEPEISDFEGLFGIFCYTASPTTTTSPVSTSFGPKTVTSTTTVEWTFPAGTQNIEFAWFPQVQHPDSATLTIAVEGGILTGVSGEQPDQRAVSTARFGSFDGNGLVYVTLAGSTAQPSAVPQAGTLGSSFSESNGQGLGSAALSLAAAFWALGIAYPAFAVFRRQQDRLATLDNTPAAAIAVTGGVVAASLSFTTSQSSQDWPWTVTLALLVALLVFGASRRVRLRAVITSWSSAVVALCLCAGFTSIVFLPQASIQPVITVVVAVVCLLAAWLLAAVSPTHGAKLATILVPLAIVMSLISLPTSLEGSTRFDVEYWLEYGAVPCALFGVSVAALGWPLLAVRRPWHKRRGPLLFVFGISAIPLLQHVGNSATPSWSSAPHIDLMTVAAAIAVLGLASMIRSGRSAEGVISVGARSGAIAVIAIACAGYGWVSDAWAGFVVLLAVAAGHVVIPKATADRGLLLARIDTRAHGRHVHRLQMVRTISASERQFHRDSIAAIALNTGERLKIEDYEARSREFRRRTAQAGDQRLIDRALGSLAGSSPWESALAGLGYGTLIGLPLMAEIFVRTNVSALSVFQAGSVLALAVVVLHSARWLAYGFVYGFFYTRLRGQSAYAKAIWFAAIMTVPELAASWPTYTSRSVALGSAVVVLRLFAFTGVLATLWEIRQARRAGAGWDAVRNLRSMRNLAAPSSAILLAVVTALATALASTEIPQLITPQQSKPAVSSTPHPG